MGAGHLPRALVHRSDFIGWVFDKTLCATHNIIVVEIVAPPTREEISQYDNEMYWDYPELGVCFSISKWERLSQYIRYSYIYRLWDPYVEA